MKIWINGNLRHDQQKTLAGGDLSAAFRGGVYETIAVRNGQPKLLSLHLARLRRGLVRLQCDLEYSDEQLTLALADTVNANALTNAWTRIVVAPQGLYGLQPLVPVVIITATALPDRSTPLRLALSPFRRNPYSAIREIKAATWIENDLITNEAKQSGFDGALLLDTAGFVSECPNANVFFVLDGQLCTPSLSTGCLAGVVREFLCSQLPVREVEITTSEFSQATEMFVTSAISGVQSVASVQLANDVQVQFAPTAGEFTQQAQTLYANA